MFLLGLLAFIQNVWLPGFLLVKFLNLVPASESPASHRLRGLVYGFGLSLASNYLLVFYLTLLKLYTPLTLYLIIGAEIGALIYYYHRQSRQGKRGLHIDIMGWVGQVREFLNTRSLTYRMLLILALGVLSLYLFYFFYFLGAVFMHWDPTIAWNPYAVQWAGNHLPAHTWRYPQLMPTNWSISYVLMQNTEVQCFAKAFMPLFSVANLLLFLDLALHKKRAVFLLGLIFHGMLTGYIYHPSIIVSGYVDIGVSFFAFLAFHVLFVQDWGQAKNQPFRFLKRLCLALFFAASAAITKQAGLFILAVVLAWVIVIVVRHRHYFSRKQKIGVMLSFLAILFLVTGSWYLLKELQIRAGTEVSEIAMVQSVHQNPDYPGRMKAGVERITGAHHPKLRFLFYGLGLLILLGVFARASRGVVLVIVLPYFLQWGLFFSYDARNLALAVPFMAFSGAFGLAWAKKRGGLLLAKIPALSIPLLPLALTLLALLVALNFTLFTPQAIQQQQEREKLKMGEPELNDKLLSYQNEFGLKGKIATNYAYLAFLPGLKAWYYQKNSRITVEFLDFLATPEGGEIGYLLLPMVLKHEKQVYARFQQECAAGRLRIVFRQGGYWFVEVLRGQAEGGGQAQK